MPPGARVQASFTPRRVAARSWRQPLLGLASLGIAIAGLAVTTNSVVPPAEFAMLPSPPTSSPAPRTVPRTVACHGLPRMECRAIVLAALHGLPPDGAAVIAAAAWPSLLCGSTFDCPPGQLGGVAARGSVILHFDDGSTDAAFNVVDRVDGVGIGDRTVVWSVRWPSPDLWSASSTSGAPRGPHPIPR